jgi:hypothetical protein
MPIALVRPARAEEVRGDGMVARRAELAVPNLLPCEAPYRYGENSSWADKQADR